MVSSRCSSVCSGGDTLELLGVVGLVVALVAVIAFIVFVEAARRKMPVSYAKRHVGRQLVGGQQTTMPLKLNMGGVIPVIFASSVLVDAAEFVCRAAPQEQSGQRVGEDF